MKKTLLAALLAVISATSAFSQKTGSPSWKQGEVMILLRHPADAVRLVEKSRSRTPSSSHRLKRLEPMADRKSSIGRAMSRLGARELVPLHQPGMMTASRTTSIFGRQQHNPDPFTAEEEDLISRLFLLRYDANGIDAPAAAAILRATDEVETAEPNLLMHIMADDSVYVIPPDSVTTVTATRLNEQWWLRNTGVTDLWKQKLIKNLRIKIAIVDTGVDIHHPDLAGNVSFEGYDFPRDTADVVDFHGHGTHCAGIAAANGREQISGACPEAIILPVTVMDSQGLGSLFDIMLGVIYALRHGSHIISMSLGGYGESDLYQSVITAVANHSMVFAAAGNDGICLQASHRDLHGMATPHIPCIPGAYPGVVGVMSTDEDGMLSSFSNFDCDGPLRADTLTGFNYELRAPGRNILSTLPDGKYGYMSGTSMACPLVAGAVARLCLSSRWSSFEQLLKTLIMTQTSQLNVFRALTVSYEHLMADTFQLQTDSLTMTFVRLDSATVQLGDGIHPAITLANGSDGTQELPTLTLPDEVRGLAVTIIAPHAFDGCEQTNILRLGRNICRIEHDAMTGCSSLTQLYTVSSIPPECAATAFSSKQLSSVCLNIVNGFTAPYASAPVWCDFKQRNELGLVTGNRFQDVCYLYPANSQPPIPIPATYIIYNMESGIGQVGAGEIAIDANATGELVIPDEVNSLQMAVIGDEAFHGCQKLIGVQLPQFLQQIWSNAFRSCLALQEILLPEHVRYVGSRAFASCSALNTLRLSPDLQTISNFAFAECPNLQLIVAPMQAPPPLPENAFITKIPSSGSKFDLAEVGAVYETARLVVPHGCRYLYADATGWQLFRHIDEMTEDGQIPDAIHQPLANVNLPTFIYSLTGQRHSSSQSLPSGIYIIGKRKVVVK